MSSAQRRACRERRSRAARSEVYGCAVDAASPDGARFGQQLLQSARDRWSVGGGAFAVARGARSLRPYVAGALAVVLVVGGLLAAVGVTLRHDGTLVERIAFGLSSAYLMAVVSNAAAVGIGRAVG
jgi:hypothetical protein